MRLVRVGAGPSGSNPSTRPPAEPEVRTTTAGREPEARATPAEPETTIPTRVRNCPDCALELVALRVADRRTEYCPACQGMWLPRDPATPGSRPVAARHHPAGERRREAERATPQALPLRLVSGGSQTP